MIPLFLLLVHQIPHKGPQSDGHRDHFRTGRTAHFSRRFGHNGTSTSSLPVGLSYRKQKYFWNIPYFRLHLFPAPPKVMVSDAKYKRGTMMKTTYKAEQVKASLERIRTAASFEQVQQLSCDARLVGATITQIGKATLDFWARQPRKW